MSSNIHLTVQSIMDGADPRDIPIPILENPAPASGYRNIPIDLNGLVEEPLASISIREHSYYHFEAIHHPLYKQNFQEASSEVLLRTSLKNNLIKINQFLKSFNVELFALDGYRPLVVQAGIRSAFTNLMCTKLGSRELAEIEADKFYSRAPNQVLENDPTTWFAHVTGGACDFVLSSGSGFPLEMGAVFDDMSTKTATWFYELEEPKDETSMAARISRRLLFWALTTHGWVNFPSEFFHYDFLTPNFRTQFGIQNARQWGLQSFDSANVGPAVYNI